MNPYSAKKTIIACLPAESGPICPNKGNRKRPAKKQK